MSNDYDIICLSAHLDDAVLSCGGYLHGRAASGARVLIATLFSAGPSPDMAISPFARRFLESCGLAQDGGRQRKAEDVEACRILGVDHVHLDFLDALFRSGPAGAPLYSKQEQLFAPLLTAEASKTDELGRALRHLPEACEVLAPLAVGGHVDHVLTRTTAERLFARCIRYYEDFPYCSAQTALRRCTRPSKEWRFHLYPIGQEMLRVKIKAMAAYASQTTALFGDSRQLSLKVKAFARRTGGERLWEHRIQNGQPG